MSKPILIVLCLMAVLFSLAVVVREHRAVSAQVATPAPPPPGPERPKQIVPKLGARPAPPAWTGSLVPPGSYTPKGFPSDFRNRIINDFGGLIDARLGKDFPDEKRKRAAEIQNQFWDEHGPTVDLFQDGRITQPEFAERTHLAMAHMEERFAQLFTDDEFQKVFDAPRGTDFYYGLFHSADEQPGMPVKPYENGSPDYAKLPPPATPAPSAPRQPVQKPEPAPPPTFGASHVGK